MSDILFWHDSEVLQVLPSEHPDAPTRLVLSAAAVQRSGSLGFLKPLAFSFAQARLSGPTADCMGSLAEGSCLQGGITTRQLTLPWVSEGPVQLSLRFRHGSVLHIEAASARSEPADDARFIESYAC
ncbi:MAG: hypothetical protein HYX44_13720 [Aquabacterium sp.]|nr:hypothetical protein [Aquabacterium sp.]